ncbi:MAG TPA: rhomboid family intramembrane serine protease [Polyangia bacterium]|nr:rhomboid family intramembrane serine protease [Polyangia bacterium]
MLPLRDTLPTRSRATVNLTLIAVNVVVFVLELSGKLGPVGPETIALPGALVPAQLVADPAHNVVTLLTHMFLHGGLAHIAGNMLFLWIFGDNVEDALGHLRYAVFYLACGMAAAAAQIGSGPHSTVPMVGASGAISGVLAGYLLLYPRSPIQVLNPIPVLWLFWGLFMWLPAWFVIIEWFAVNLWSAFQPTPAAGGVAFFAHVGGFVAGLALLPLLRSRDRVSYDRWERVLRPRGRPMRG